LSAGELLAGLPLVDAHCHRLLAQPVDAAALERCCTEAGRLPPGMAWDSPAGLAVRRWCPPVLDLPAFAPPNVYVARRTELGVDEVNVRLMRAASLSHLLVDTGLPGPERPSEREARPTMELYNADGSRAEMSGNGIRCLAMAMVDAGLSGPEMIVQTDAGRRRVTVDDDGWASVDMGMAKVDAKDVGLAFVDMGNPHTVVEVEDLSRLAIAKRAAEWTGRNVEFVVIGPGTEELSMRVWERGVGETLACGTGAAAAAAAAFVWGRVGPHVTVHQPGGAATVHLESDTIVLSGPADHIATVEVPWL
jgi:diaminopimelate epimerase